MKPYYDYDLSYICDMIESYELFPKKLFTPRDDFMAKYGVPSMAKAVEELSMKNAEAIYGKPLPKYVETRLQKELTSIIGNGFSSIYYISHMLVKNSNLAGPDITRNIGSVLSRRLHTFCNSRNTVILSYSLAYL